jgi:rhomboid protease GluP
MRQRQGSVLCPSCGQLVGVNDERCYNCGRLRPGLFGFAGLARKLGDDLGFLPLVLGACGLLYISALYISTLAIDPSAVRAGGLLTLFSPGSKSLLVLGASGSGPVFRLGRWWTVLSAGWLHAGVLHIVLNMMSVRALLPAMAQLYGPARTVIIYVLAGATGFTASSLAGRYLTFLPGMLRGAPFTVGASASVFGLIGALLYYGRRGGSRVVAEQARRWALGGILFGFAMPGIDNWAHLGGMAGGYLVSRWLDPLKPERGDHALVALLCLVVSLAAIVYSVVTGLSFVR